MKLLPPVACFLAAVISGGHSLMCDTCSNANGDSCTGPPNTCDAAQDRCISTLTETVTSKGKAHSFARGCGRAKECGRLSTLSNEQVKVSSSSKCCSTDRCPAETVSVPRRETQANGLMCPACFAPGTEECTGQSTVPCAGVENQCIKYGMPVQMGGEPPYAMRGCANAAMCESKGKLSFPGITVDLKKFECSHGSHLQHSFSLSVLVGFPLLFRLLS
ncbi:phospholipase A2 inhibitor and Ly6/PLAUR domain-containing protein-like [Lissotriton helveticus]